MLVSEESVDFVKIDSSLSENQKEKMIEVCKEYDDVLTDIPGRTELIEHSVVLNTEIPIYQSLQCGSFQNCF